MRDPVVVIETQTQRERRISPGYVVLRKECFLLDVCVTVKNKRTSSTRKVKR